MKLEDLAARLAQSTKAYVEQAIAPLRKALDTLDAAVKSLPAGPQGEKGDKGESGDRGEKGDPGLIGPPGRDGIDGKDGKDGIDGKDGAPGPAGEKGERGERGDPGASVMAEDLLPMFEAAFAKWALEVERRANDLFARTAAAMPVPQDGLSVDDLELEHDGDGNVTFRFVRGELKKEFAIRLPRFKDCGVYREDGAYREGDGVTFGGSFWIAQKDTPEGKPDGGTGHWRLAVKRGRDGRDAR